jgi:hypothetical protein
MWKKFFGRIVARSENMMSKDVIDVDLSQCVTFFFFALVSDFLFCNHHYLLANLRRTQTPTIDAHAEQN